MPPIQLKHWERKSKPKMQILLTGLSDSEIALLLDEVFDANSSDIEIDDYDPEVDIQDSQSAASEEDEVVSDNESSVVPTRPVETPSHRDPTQRWRHRTEYVFL